ncbi:hypothetical protein TWF694_005139 [Orbilia ellipsospora]|uniref:Peptidase A1 domain-containing protein n=1 Tax=Orbilia ellipsospora TaxID=2528407 RepID=A0AAV9WUU2_9PEZI
MYAVGAWVSDTVYLGGTAVESASFGIVTEYQGTPSLGLGIGAPGDTLLAPFLKTVKLANLINTPTYGIYFGDWRAQNVAAASMTMGGLDLAKFTMPLKTYTQNSNDIFSITLDKIGIISIDGTDISLRCPTPLQGVHARFSISHPFISLPDSFLENILIQIHAVQDESHNWTVTEIPDEIEGLEFTLPANLTIFLPFSQIVAPHPTEKGLYYVLLKPLGTEPSVILGVPFFRSAYFFYDYEKTEISIAAGVYNATETAIREVGHNNTSVRLLGLDGIQPPTKPVPYEPNLSYQSMVKLFAGGMGGLLFIVFMGSVSLLVYRRLRRMPPPFPPPPMYYTGVYTGYKHELFAPTHVKTVNPVAPGVVGDLELDSKSVRGLELDTISPISELAPTIPRLELQ